MLKIAILFYIIIAPTMMGALVTVILVSPSLFSGVNIMVAAALGAALAAPASWFVARAIRMPGEKNAQG